MASDQGPVVQSALLTRELTRLRKAAELTQQDVATDLEWHPSKLIRLEGGKTGITKTDLEALLKRYGVTSPGEVERLAELNRGARQPAWWDRYKNEIQDAGYLSYIGYEAGAASIKDYETVLIPGLLQTEAYAHIITEGYVPNWEIGPVVAVRLQRQRELAQRSKPPRKAFILDEAAIRRRVGIRVDPSIMPGQLEHLILASEQDDVTIQVIPFGAGAHVGMRGSFVILDFEGDLDSVVYLESGRRVDQTFTSGDPRVPDYQTAFEGLREEALSPGQSLDLIRQVADEMS